MSHSAGWENQREELLSNGHVNCACYRGGWQQGVADASAKLVGCVAAELGHDHPLIDKLVLRLGSLTPPGAHHG